MLKSLFKLHILYVLFVREAYATKNSDNTSNAAITSYFLLVFNFHSIAILFERCTNLRVGILNYWIPNNIPKSGYGYIGAMLFFVLYLFFIYIVKHYTSYNERISILRKILLKSRDKVLSRLYIFLTLILFVITFFVLLKAVIPQGGI